MVLALRLLMGETGSHEAALFDKTTLDTNFAVGDCYFAV